MVLDNKEIHFYPFSWPQFNYPHPILHTWRDTHEAIYAEDPDIHTTQMAILGTFLWDKGYKTFVHDRNGVYEIHKGNDNSRTSREIRRSHNLFKMWVNGEFDIN